MDRLQLLKAKTMAMRKIKCQVDYLKDTMERLLICFNLARLSTILPSCPVILMLLHRCREAENARTSPPPEIGKIVEEKCCYLPGHNQKL